MYELSPETLRREGIAVLPATLRDAIDALEADAVMRGALRAAFAETYIAAKREEWELYHGAVPRWEIDHYLDIY